MSKKKMWVLATVSAVGLTYAIVGSNAFADTTVTPTPTVTTPAAPTPSVTPPAAPSIDPSPLSTLPSAGNVQDKGDGQVGDQTDSANQSGDNEDGAVTNGDDNGDDDGDNSVSGGVSASTSVDNGGDSQQNNDGQDGSGSND